MAIKKVLLLSVRAGAGHQRAAEAVEHALRAREPEIAVEHIEALSRMSRVYSAGFSTIYGALYAKVPSLWRMVYESMERKAPTARQKRLSAFVGRMHAGALIAEINRFDPDYVLCTHYVPAEIACHLRLSRKLRAPIGVVLTDYDIHTMWIHNGVDDYFVATPEMAFTLKQKGAGSARVNVSGIPIMPVFAAEFPHKSQLREKLGIATEKPTVLLSAGGCGAGAVDRVVRTLAAEFPRAQFLCVAGRNQALQRALEAAAADFPGRLVPFGFISNMHELMAASDFTVSKAGGLTSSECLALALPMVIIDPIPGQEERNSDVLLEHGAAVRAHSHAHLIFKVGTLLDNESVLLRMRAAAKTLAKAHAADTVAGQVLATVAAAQRSMITNQIGPSSAQPYPPLTATLI